MAKVNSNFLIKLARENELYSRIKLGGSNESPLVTKLKQRNESADQIKLFSLNEL